MAQYTVTDPNPKKDPPKERPRVARAKKAVAPVAPRVAPRRSPFSRKVFN